MSKDTTQQKDTQQKDTQQKDEMTAYFNIGGKKYRFDLSDINGVEARDFKRAVGVPLFRAFQGVDTGETDPLEVMAGLKWITDRREDPTLEFETVLAGLDYAAIADQAGTDDEDPPA